MKKEILDLLYQYRVDFSPESRYTDFGIREEDFDKLSEDLLKLLSKRENNNHIKTFEVYKNKP